MRILFVIRDVYQQETVRNGLASLSEQDSIYFVCSYHEAEYFIQNNVVKHQLPLDLIITQDKIHGYRAVDFFKKITKDKSATYSNRDFLFHKIPVVILVDENRTAFLNDGFALVLDDFGLEKLHLWKPGLVGVAKDWRRHVLDELDDLGIRFNSGTIDYTYVLSRKKRTGTPARILSGSFKQLPRRLPYNWVTANERQIEIAIDQYIKELKRACRLNAKRDEKRFHALFNKYPFLIQRDNYSHKWYEARLDYENNRSFQPDFSLKPNFNQVTDLSILEIKLPNEAFIAKSPFHPGPLQGLMSHIFQVNDYKDYLESDQYQAEIKKTFGFIPNKVEYNILMGRLDEKTNGLQVLNKRMKQMGATHINLLTFDELLNYQVKYLDRIKLLKII